MKLNNELPDQIDAEAPPLTLEEVQNRPRSRRLVAPGGLAIAVAMMVIVGVAGTFLFALDSPTTAPTQSATAPTIIEESSEPEATGARSSTEGRDTQILEPEWTVHGVSPGLQLRQQGYGALAGPGFVAAAGYLEETVSVLDIETGSELWKRDVSRTGTSGLVTAVLMVNEEVVVAGGHGYVTALEVASGEIRWRSEFDPNLLPSRAAVADSDTIFVSLDRPMEGDDKPPEVIALNLERGTTLWSAVLDGIDQPADVDLEPMGFSLAEDTILVSVTSGAFGLDPETGAIRWVVEYGRAEMSDVDGYVPSGVPPESYYPSPFLVIRDSAYSGDPDGELVAIDVASGELLGQWEFPGRVSPLGMVDELLLVTGTTGATAIDLATDGQVRWHVETEVSVEIFHDGTIYASGPRKTTAISAEGEILWQHETIDDTLYSVVASSLGIVVSAENRIEILDPQTGEATWTIPSGAYQPPQVVGEKLLIADNTGTLGLFAPSASE